MAERLRDVHPDRHAGGVRQRDGFGDRLHQPAVRGDLGEVDDLGRVVGEPPLERGQVERAGPVDLELDRLQTAPGERGQVRTPLGRHHRDPRTGWQRPRAEQRAQAGGGALDERDAVGRDAEQLAGVGPQLLEHVGHFLLGHVGAEFGFPPRVRRRRLEGGQRLASGRGRVEVQHLCRRSSAVNSVQSSVTAPILACRARGSVVDGVDLPRPGHRCR